MIKFAQQLKKFEALKIKPNNKIIGEGLKVVDGSTLTFNIITTNKKRIAIAPTYIIIKIRPKNSTLNINKIAAAFAKADIKYKTE